MLGHRFKASSEGVGYKSWRQGIRILLKFGSSTVGCRPVIGVLLCHNNSEAKKEKTKERKDSQN